MDKRAIIFLCILIALPFGGIYILIKGIIDNNIAQLISGVISCVIAFILWVVVIYFIKKHPKDGQGHKKTLTSEEQRQRSLAFVKKHSKAFLVWSIVSAAFAVTSMVLLIIFAKYSDVALIILTICMFAFVMIFIALFCSYVGAKWESKKNKKQNSNENVEHSFEFVGDINTANASKNDATEVDTFDIEYKNDMTEQEQRNAEAMRQMQKGSKQRRDDEVQKYQVDWIKWKTEQERLDRERIEREKQENEKIEKEQGEREQKSIEYFNEHKYALTKKYSTIVFNFIEKLTENYPYLFLKMFKDTEIPMSSILVNPYSNISQLLETKILLDGLKFTEAADSNMNKEIQELTDFFIQGLKKRIVDSGDYDDDFTFPTLLYYIVRNNVIKYYRNGYVETYGYDNLEEFCDHIANPFDQDKTNIKVLDNVLTISRFMSNNAITQFVYYYIYENDIKLPFVDTYKKIVIDMKKNFERKQKEKLESDLFGKPKKETAISDTNPATTQSPIDHIDRMSGEQFEIYMEDYFKKQGFKVTRTPLSGDYGIDLIIENDFSKIGVQAKRYSDKVSLSAVQEVIGGLRHYGLSSGMVVTNSTFQASAIQLAKDNNITLWNRDKLIEKLGE